MPDDVDIDYEYEKAKAAASAGVAVTAPAPTDDGGISAGASINVGPSRPEAISGAFREPVGRFDEQIAASKARSAAEDAAFPISRESRKRLIRAKLDRDMPEMAADRRLPQDTGPSDARTFARYFPNIKTQEDADFAEAQMYQSKRASRTAEEVADASVTENVAKKSPFMRGVLNAGTTLAGFSRAATGGYFGGLIGHGDRQESKHLDKLNAALEDADGWTKYLHAAGEGIGAGVGIGGLARGMGIGKAMATYGAVATQGGLKERALGAAEMAAFGKVAQFLTPSTQKMLARLPETLRGPVIAKAIDLADEFAGGVGSEVFIRAAKGEDVTAEALVLSGFLNAAQASLRKVALDATASADAPARPLEAPKPEVVPEVTAPVSEPVAAPVEPARAVEAPPSEPIKAPAPEAPADPRKMADDLGAATGGKVEDLLSGSAVLTRGEQDAVRGAWSLLSRAIGEQGTARDVYERSPEGATRSDMADALRTIEHVYDLRVRRGKMPESEADTSLPGAGRPALPEAPAAPREEVIQPAAEAPKSETPPPVEPPVATPMAPTGKAPDGFPVSIKNDAVAESRAKRMLGPLAEPARLANQEALDAGLAAIEANPKKPYQIAKRLAESAAEPTPLEGAILLAHRVKLQHELNLAHEEGVRAAANNDADGIKDARNAEAEAEAAMAEADLVAKRSGTEKGRELQFRKVLAGQDYTVEGIRRKVRSAGDFKPLSHDELAQTKAAGEQIAELTKARDAQTEKAEAAEARKVIDEIVKTHATPKDAETPAKTESGASNKIFTKEAADAALARILARARESRTKTNIQFDPTWIKDYVIRGGYHIERGVRTFGRWAKAMVKDFGDEVRPHLEAIYAESRKELSGKDIESVSAEMAKGVKEGKDISANDVGKVAEALVRSGVHGAENISKAIHEVLKKVDPTITQSEANRILVKYGQIVKMNQDPVKVELRDIKAQLVQIERLKDMENKIPPPRQGLQRDTPSDALRELNRRVEEARRKGGFRVVDPVRQLKSTLDGIQKRWKNEAADKIKEIEAGRKVIPVKSDPLANADAATKAQHAAAKAEIEKVRERYREVFGKSGMTDAQRAEAALKAVEKSIVELKRRAKAGDVFTEKVDPVQGPVEERMAELLAEQKELRAVIKDIHDLYDPKLTENEKTIRRLNRTLDALNAQIDSGVVPGKKARVEKPLSPEALQIEQKILQAKRDVDKIVQRKLREQETRVAQAKRIALKEIPSLLRVWGITFDFGSTLVQGGFRSLSHPIEMARTFGKGLKSFASASARDADDARILNDPAYATANKQKSGMTGLEPGRVVDEAIRSRWMHDTWGLRNFERFTHTMLNNMRLNASKTMNKKTQDNWLLRLTQAIGVASSRTGVPTPAEAKAIGEGVNILTGRGTSRSHRVNQFLDSATVIALAPRYSLSTFQAALGTPMWRGTARTRTAFATEYGRAAVSVGALIGIGMAFGWTPDKFGILHKGTMSFDPSMGMARVWKLATKVYGSIFGDVEEEKAADRDYAGRYARQRLHPIAGALWSRTTGKTVERKEATYEQLGADIVTPMILKDFLKAKENEGAPAGLLMLGLSAIGARASSHQPKADERGRRKGGR